ncbi:aromatic ring-hydroxylating oxygenase subunit alpha [Henriciella litoralis]|uniref:aromatic ring-hydroxylating oxygenase subunit alpha n=1 Tax=Henriciella litoralis TaxID=568102 RepID=UPI000A05BE2E|nr:aromatic ring-hydroxylating dioxygenase subunit alpha [Henriciella litoralis]
MNVHDPKFRPDRHPAISYGEVLDMESRDVPDYLREGRVVDFGPEPVAASRYFDRTFFEKEAEHVWSRTWQLACREEDIPKVGDFHIYEILGRSLIVVRSSENEIKAFYNACLHRGRKLVTQNGCKQEFKCPYHGFTWNRDGSFKENPIDWDFQHIPPENYSLPEAKVECWGGFVFINFDPAAKPLMDVIKPLAEDFERFDFANRYRAAWVQKVVPANWKATAEAFMEAHHSVTTHPQILPGIGDANSQYDVPNDWVSRQFSATGIPSPFIEPPSEQEILNYLTGRKMKIKDNSGGPELPEGTTARKYVAEGARASLSEQTGKDYSHATDAEMLDSILYNVFPNMCFWAGYVSNIVYRWRPNGTDPDTSIMDIMILRPYDMSGERPKPAPMQRIEIDEPMSDAEEQFGADLCAVFEQDMGNLRHVQSGLKASGNGAVTLGRYSEQKIAQLHKMIDRLIIEGESMNRAGV